MNERVIGHDSRPHHVAVGDFNQDGHLDLVVANSNTDNIGLLIGYGNGTFFEQMTYPTGTGSNPYSIVVGNFDNDAFLHIVVTNYGMNSIGVLLGDGNGSFGSPILTSLCASRPLSSAKGDFNKDNPLYIAVANYGTLTIAVLFGLNNGSFRTHAIYEMAFDSVPYSITVADLNSDNRLDIGAVNYGTSDLAVLLATANGSFTIHQYSTGRNSHPCSIAVADFNNDHYFDIAVANSGTSSVGIFLGNSS